MEIPTELDIANRLAQREHGVAREVGVDRLEIPAGDDELEEGDTIYLTTISPTIQILKE